MQCASTLLMVRPAHFGFNEQTSANNHFQKKAAALSAELVLQEFDAMVDLLMANGIEVIQIKDDPSVKNPDAIFPNNWLACNKNITLFPMYASNRRSERRIDIVNDLVKQTGIERVNDMSLHEENGIYLEGTGSMVCDHENKIIYACISERTNKELVKEYAELHGYTTCVFTAADISGREIYHTNVMMCIGEGFAIICNSAIHDTDKQMVFGSFQRTGHTVIDISFHQMECFAGNMLHIKNKADQSFILMSRSAYSSLDRSQIHTLENFAKFIVADVPTIENIGGGSVRCMVAEIFY